MTDLVEQLRARAAELRGRAESRDRCRYDFFCAELAVYDRSLADLIDGTLAEYANILITLELVPDGMYAKGARDAVEREMEALSRHVSSVIGEVTA